MATTPMPALRVPTESRRAVWRFGDVGPAGLVTASGRRKVSLGKSQGCSAMRSIESCCLYSFY